MKNLTLILGLLYAIFDIHAQNWPSISTQWFYDSNESVSSYQVGLNYYEVIKDTLIESKKCSMLNSGDLLYSDSTGNVYRYNNSRKKFYLFYSFNAKIGDSLIVFVNTKNDSVIYTVSKIDTIKINNYDKKRFYLKSINQVGWFWGKIIEGVGSDFNMFPYYGAVDPCFCGSLRCYQDLILGLYKTDNSLPCDTIIHISINSFHSDIKVYPNPFNDYFTVSLYSNKIYKVNIFDFMGRLINQYQIQNSGNIGFELKSGIYFMRIIDNKSVYNYKIIKKI
jgi:hypothetical protein